MVNSFVSLSLLNTKVTPPQPPRQLLRRERLIESLSRCRDYKLTLISAGAGYGKTTLLTDFATSANMALCWYTLDEEDRDPAVFCRYLLHSIRRLYPDFGQGLEQLLDQNLTELHQKSTLHRLADEFINDLEFLKNLDGSDIQETLIVLDDYQFAESFGVNTFVSRLLDWLPPRFHLIIASRIEPSDLGLTKLLAKQRLVVIGQFEIEFTEAEVHQLLLLSTGLEQIAFTTKLAAYSQGWVTAVVLAINNLNIAKANSRLVEGLLFDKETIDPKGIFDYLAQEVFKNQSLQIQEFLLRTSVFDLLSPSECNALLEQTGCNNLGSAANILEQLEHQNLFTSRLQSNSKTFFQYHALFRQFLTKRLAQDKELYRLTQEQAAKLRELAGVYPDAIRHYVAAGDVTKAANLLNQVAEPMYQNGRNNLLSSLLQSLPPHTQNSLPRLLDVQARLLLEKGENGAALQAYGSASQYYLKQELPDYAARATANQTQILVRTGQYRQAALLYSQIIETKEPLLKTSVGQQAVALAQSVAGIQAMEERRYEAAEKHFKEATTLYQTKQETFYLAVLDNQLGRMYFQQGRLVKSNIYYERSLAFFVKSGSRSREMYCRTSLAINLYTQARYQAAEAQLLEVLVLFQSLEDRYLLLHVLNYLGNIYRETERYVKADTVYSQALQMAREGQVHTLELLVLNEQALNHILQNQSQDAQKLLRLSQELAEEYELPDRKGLTLLNQSFLDFTNRFFKRSLASLIDALALFSDANSRPNVARSKLLEGVILMAMGEPKKAIAALSASVELAETLGYEPYLPHELKRATTLMEYAARKKISVNVETFLQKHGFISNLLETDPAPPLILLKDTFLVNQDKIQEVETPNPSTLLQIYGLNGGRVWLGQQEIKDWRNSKAREALFYLAEHHMCSRDELIEALWSDDIIENAPQALHNNLFLLRKAIAPVEIKLKSGRYYISGDFWYDANQFASAIGSSLQDANCDATQLVKTLNLYKRDFLDQSYSNWVVQRQQELLQLYMRGLEKLAQDYEQKAQNQQALRVWQQLLIKDPYNEKVYRNSINCLLKLGNKPEAQRQAALCLKALEELDLKPSYQTAQLFQKLA